MLLCGEIDSYPYKNKDYGPILSVTEVPLNGIATVARCCTLSFSERNVPFPGEQYCFTCTSKAVRHVHLRQYDMCMWSSFTCTCKTTSDYDKDNLSLRGKQTILVRKADLIKTYLHTPHLFRVLKKVFFCKKETDSLYIIR